MSDVHLEFFHTPAYKLLISDLRLAVQDHSTASENSDEFRWSLKIFHIAINNNIENVSLESLNKEKPYLELDIKLVWVQGKITKIEKTETGNYTLKVTDDENDVDEATVLEYNSVPGGDHPDVKLGSYIGILAQMWSNTPTIILKPTKIMCLNDRTIHKAVWKDEVAIAKAFLAGIIIPDMM